MARRLYISPRTVKAHLRHVFARLGVPNRVAHLLAGSAHGGRRAVRARRQLERKMT